MASSDLAGRAAEVGVLLALAEDVVLGRAGALFISGAAGIGKTALVRRVERPIDAKIAVRWMRCLPMTALATPLLPVRTALGGPLPGTGFAAMRAVDDWLAQRPTLLVVDDLQWADPATLDLFPGRPAYRSALGAAAGASAETATRLLRRAVDLAPQLEDAAPGPADLFRRLRAAAAAAGRDSEEIVAVTELLDHLDQDRDRAEMIELLVRRSPAGDGTRPASGSGRRDRGRRAGRGRPRPSHRTPDRRGNWPVARVASTTPSGT